MSISDAYVSVECDAPRCRENEDVTLTALGTRGREWDDRNVKAHLERLGWTVDGNRTLCPEHAEGRGE